MTVIPFPSCRFTPADLAAFYEVALPKCSRGSWAGVARQTLLRRARTDRAAPHDAVRQPDLHRAGG